MRNSGIGRSAGRLSPLALALLVVALLLGTTGGAVAGALITGAQIKNGTVTGADIKDASLTHVDIADEPRAWGAMKNTTTNDFTTAAWTPVVSKSLSLARAGYLTVTASLYAEDDATLTGVGYLNYALRIDGKVVDAYKALDFQADGGPGQSGSTTLVVPAAKGSHTVQLVVSEDGSGSFLYGGEISAVYTPTGSASGLDFASRPTHGRVNH
ncbi:hypothetical protein BJ993_001452 [Nocardioides aromaticivorans]|uniref:Uncharacterized protein n=1 Tax=Nocardioides aromaticivorans TaxID=200618 RepID=A0A7Z0CN24_9ACTN|nr:hypothetical protein [Nocardioides aromaticivorans]NYI44372.1 hypothetical protein [Nocardioides aromaticivorans]